MINDIEFIYFFVANITDPLINMAAENSIAGV